MQLTYRFIPNTLTFLAVVLVTIQVRFLPKEVTAVEFVPFCAFIGGVAGSFKANLLDGRRDFPRRESFRGVLLGTLFGLLFIVFGVVHV